MKIDGRKTRILTGRNNPMFGRKHSEKTKRLIGLKRINKHTPNIDRHEDVTIICYFCGRKRIVKYKQRNLKTCSKSCAAKLRYLNPEYCKRMSLAIKGKTGGFRDFNGNNSGYYKNILFQSSWELAYIIYNLEHNIPFERNKESFKYIFNGQNKKYYPDFIQGDTFIEIKGFKSLKTEAKENYFPKNKILKILYREDIKPYLKYCTSKYGSNFVKLLKEKKNESFSS